jgi:hypothetical protein
MLAKVLGEEVKEWPSMWCRTEDIFWVCRFCFSRIEHPIWTIFLILLRGIPVQELVNFIQQVTPLSGT